MDKNCEKHVEKPWFELQKLGFNGDIMDYDGEMMTVMVTLSVSSAASCSWCKRTKTSKNNAHADVTVSKGMVILSKPTNTRFRRSQQTLGPGYY